MKDLKKIDFVKAEKLYVDVEFPFEGLHVSDSSGIVGGNLKLQNLYYSCINIFSNIFTYKSVRVFNFEQP